MDRRLLEAYDSLEIIKGDNLPHDDSGFAIFRCLYSLLK